MGIEKVGIDKVRIDEVGIDELVLWLGENLMEGAWF